MSITINYVLLDARIEENIRKLKSLAINQDDIDNNRADIIKDLAENVKLKIDAGFYPDKKYENICSIIMDIVRKRNIRFIAYSTLARHLPNEYKSRTFKSDLDKMINDGLTIDKLDYQKYNKIDPELESHIHSELSEKIDSLSIDDIENLSSEHIQELSEKMNKITKKIEKVADKKHIPLIKHSDISDNSKIKFKSILNDRQISYYPGMAQAMLKYIIKDFHALKKSLDMHITNPEEEMDFYKAGLKFRQLLRPDINSKTLLHYIGWSTILDNMEEMNLSGAAKTVKIPLIEMDGMQEKLQIIKKYKSISHDEVRNNHMKMRDIIEGLHTEIPFFFILSQLFCKNVMPKRAINHYNISQKRKGEEMIKV